MKHKGSCFEYSEERDKDLLRAYTSLLQSTERIVLPELWKKLVNMPSERFWVSEERAAIVVSRMIKGDNLEKMRPNAREMYQELYKRAMVIREQSPGMPLLQVLFDVIRQPAPKFYLTPNSACIIIHRAKKKAFEQRKRRLRHCITPIKK